MTLKEMRCKYLSLIEELNPDSDQLTGDQDIAAKQNEVVNQKMFEMARMKKIARYIETPVAKGQLLTFADISKELGSDVYQVGTICGINFDSKANGTVFKILEDGTAGIDCFIYPKRITDDTDPEAYTFELSQDALEILPYGIAADLLKSDVSAEYGKIYQDAYLDMVQRLDPRYQMPSIYIEGGVNI